MVSFYPNPLVDDLSIVIHGVICKIRKKQIKYYDYQPRVRQFQGNKERD